MIFVGENRKMSKTFNGDSGGFVLITVTVRNKRRCGERWHKLFCAQLNLLSNMKAASEKQSKTKAVRLKRVNNSWWRHCDGHGLVHSCSAVFFYNSSRYNGVSRMRRGVAGMLCTFSFANERALTKWNRTLSNDYVLATKLSLSNRI